MLLDLDKTTLELVRGDTFELILPLNQGTRENFITYSMQPNDCLYVGLMKPDQPFEHAEVRCALNYDCRKTDSGNPIFRLDAWDTEKLNPGKYYLTIKLKSGTKVTTLVNSKIFFVTGSNPCC